MNQTSLVLELSHLLEMPVAWHARPKPNVVKIYRTIMGAMIKALRSGEQVEIKGFGIFRVRDRAPTRHGFTHFHGNLRGTVRGVKDCPAKKYVHFQPSIVLLRMLNPPSSD